VYGVGWKVLSALLSRKSAMNRHTGSEEWVKSNGRDRQRNDANAAVAADLYLIDVSYRVDDSG